MPPDSIVIDGQTWHLRHEIGDVGGFGQVYVATADVKRAAIKLIPKHQRASRDLLFSAPLRQATNVVPVIGTSETDTYWALLMPLAEASLRQHLVSIGRPLNADDASVILVDLLDALASIEKLDVVHRDIKPENILFYDGHWCLTDFGIARYITAATSLGTWLDMKSKAYAAPEQWEELRVTSATDLYALGIVGYEMLLGHAPFRGPRFMTQHLYESPPLLQGVPHHLAAALERCVEKRPPSRLSIDAVRSALTVNRQHGFGRRASMLHDTERREHRRQSEREQDVARILDEQLRVTELAQSAKRQFQWLSTRLKTSLLEHVPSLVVDECDLFCWTARLGAVSISVYGYHEPEDEQYWTDQPEPDGRSVKTLACAHVGVKWVADNGYWAGSVASLWFCDALDADAFAWHEFRFRSYDKWEGGGSWNKSYEMERNPRGYCAKSCRKLGARGAQLPERLSLIDRVWKIDPNAIEAFVDRQVKEFSSPSPHDSDTKWPPPFEAASSAQSAKFYDQPAEGFESARSFNGGRVIFALALLVVAALLALYVIY